MAKKKLDVKALLLDKGERFALIGAGVLMLLFMILGLSEMSGGFSPDTFEKEVLATTQKVEGTINSGNVDSSVVPPLQDEYTKPPKPQPVVTHWANNLFFDPIAPPDKRRINPIVLPVTEVQADYIAAKILAYDMQKDANGAPQIGVLTQAGKKDEKLDLDRSKSEASSLTNRFGFNVGGFRPPQGGRANPPPKAGGLAQGAPIEEGLRQNVEYVPLDPEKLVGKRFAWTIYPQRMVVVQASFPYRSQIEEIQKALRLQSPLDVFTAYPGEEVPLFRGVLVQRQILNPDGRAVEVPWTDIDVYGQYADTIYRRKYGDKPDDLSVNFVLLHKGHRLAMPLPILLSGKYPEVKLNTVTTEMKRLAERRKPPPPPKAPSQFAGEGDIFEPVAPSQAGQVGQPNVGAEGIMVPKGGEGKAGEGGAAATVDEADIPQHILIRLIDNDIQPGRLYQYRLKVLMQNPNWVGPKDKKGNVRHPEKVDKVSRPADTEVMLLGADARDEAAVKARFGLDGDELRKNLTADTKWTELQGTVSVPREEYLFATDPNVDARSGRWAPPGLKAGQGLLQIQRWLPLANIEKYKEPVADWVIADIVATRGTYLGGKQLVNLPLWDSRVNRYTLRPAPPEKGKARYGVFIDPTRPGPQYIVADVEGGLRLNKPLTRNASFEEETATEILLIDENGVPTVRSSFLDRADTGRAERETAWRNWIERTEKDTASRLNWIAFAENRPRTLDRGRRRLDNQPRPLNVP